MCGLVKHRHVYCTLYILNAAVSKSFFFFFLSPQGRQKLARFNAREFATLIIDILSDAKRRQQGKGLTSPAGERALISFS